MATYGLGGNVLMPCDIMWCCCDVMVVGNSSVEKKHHWLVNKGIGVKESSCIHLDCRKTVVHTEIAGKLLHTHGFLVTGDCQC